MAFRNSRARELEDLATYCNRSGIRFDTNDSFKQALRLLRDQTHVFLDTSNNANPSLWGYRIDNLPITITSIPRHTYPSVKQIQLKLSISFLADYQIWDTGQDPIQKLNMDVMVIGSDKTGINCISSYHLDKHIDDPSTPSIHEVHPLYHIQFGSGKIRKTPEAANLNIENGGHLYLDTPRLLHYPLDFVLGFDFLLANYFPAAWSNLHRNGQYVSLCRRYQDFFWKPYIHTLAKHWQVVAGANDFAARELLWPNLL